MKNTLIKPITEIGISLPTLVICNQTGFKNEELNTHLDDFKRNTIELNDTIKVYIDKFIF